MPQAAIPIAAAVAGGAASSLLSKGGGDSGAPQFRQLNRREKELQQLQLDRAKAAQPLFLSLLGQSGQEQGAASSLIGRALTEGQLFNQLFPAQEAAQNAVSRERNVQGLGDQDAEILAQLMEQLQAGPNATPEQIARIRAATDLGIESGLSDLGHFRDQTFESIRENSASRGLRPSDTPILNQFGRSGEEFGRQAQQFTQALRAQQILQELEIPFRDADLGLRSAGTASDLLNRRRTFESNVAQQAEAARLNLGSGLRNNAAQLTGGGGNPPSISAPQQGFAPVSSGGSGLGLGDFAGALSQLIQSGVFSRGTPTPTSPPTNSALFSGSF